MTAIRVWHNGHLAPEAETHLAVNDRGLLLGDGLFATMLARNGHIVRLERHIMRLAEGAAVMKIPLPFDTHTLAAAAHETLRANGLSSAPRASLRMTLTRGTGPRGLALPATSQPTLIISAAEAPPAPDGIAVTISSVKKLAASPASALKTLNYTDHVMARLDVDATGMTEALMRSAAGGIACATIGNVFVITGNRLLTPPDDGAIRAGVTRNDVLALARGMGLEVVEAELSVDALKAADEIFLTNALWGICPVTSIGSGARAVGATTKKLAQALDAAWASDFS